MARPVMFPVTAAAWRCGAACAAIVLLSAITLAAQGGRTDPAFLEVPFAEWLSHKGKPQVPWKTYVKAMGLSWHQRLWARISIRVDGKELFKRKSHEEIRAYVQVTDRAGRVYQDHGVMQLENVDKSTRGGNANFDLDVFALPGEYDVALAVFDLAAGEHSATRKTLRIAPLKDDPLPESWSNFPPVELLPRRDKYEGYYRPDITTRLQLPLVTLPRVEVDLLVALNTRDSNSRFFLHDTLSDLLPTLKTLSQIDVRNGTLRVTMLDLLRRVVAFDQPELGELGWPILRKALERSDPGSVSIKTLQGLEQRPEFLRQVLNRWLSGRSGENSPPVSPPDASMPPAAGSEQPVRVLIVLSDPVYLSEWKRPPKVTTPANCNCRVYYIPLWQPAYDELREMLNPVRPHVFPADSPLKGRKALAAILEELRRL